MSDCRSLSAGFGVILGLIVLFSVARYILRGGYYLDHSRLSGVLLIAFGVFGLVVSYLLLRLHPWGLVGGVLFWAIALPETVVTSPQFTTRAEYAGVVPLFLVVSWLLLRNREQFGVGSSESCNT